MSKRFKDVSRYKRNVELLRHRYTTSKYSAQERAVRRRISATAKELNKQISQLNKIKNVKSFSKDLLFERLEKSGMVTKRGTIRVNLPSNLTEIDYRNIEVSIKKFKSAPSSTPKGLRKIIRGQRQRLLESTSNKEFVDSLSDREIMEFNKMYSDISFEQLSRTMGSDTVKTLAEDAAQYKMTGKEFQETMESYMTESPDQNQRAAIKRLYDRYITKLM